MDDVTKIELRMLRAETLQAARMPELIEGLRAEARKAWPTVWVDPDLPISYLIETLVEQHRELREAAEADYMSGSYAGRRADRQILLERTGHPYDENHKPPHLPSSRGPGAEETP